MAAKEAQTAPHRVQGPEVGSKTTKRKNKSDAVSNTVMEVINPCRYPVGSFSSSVTGLSLRYGTYHGGQLPLNRVTIN